MTEETYNEMRPTFLELMRMVRAQDVKPGFATLGMEFKDAEGKRYTTYFLTRANYEQATVKALGRIVPLKPEQPSPADDRVKIERTGEGERHGESAEVTEENGAQVPERIDG